MCTCLLVCVFVGFNSLNSNYALLSSNHLLDGNSRSGRETPIPRNGKLNWPPGCLSGERCSYYRATYVRPEKYEGISETREISDVEGNSCGISSPVTNVHRLLIKFSQFSILSPNKSTRVRACKLSQRRRCEIDVTVTNRMSNCSSLKRSRRTCVAQTFSRGVVARLIANSGA